ncbi:CoA-transferase [Escherichia coli]
MITNDRAFVESASVRSRQWSSPQSDCFASRHQPGNRSAHDTGEMDVVLVRRGSLIEQIRCGGAGLGGFLPRRVSAPCRGRQQTLTLDGETWLLERPLSPTWRSFALIVATRLASPLST